MLPSLTAYSAFEGEKMSSESLFMSTVERLRVARHVVIFTGAGISAESGIATFRDHMTGLWSQYDPQQLATPAAFVRDPGLVWGMVFLASNACWEGTTQ